MKILIRILETLSGLGTFGFLMKQFAADDMAIWGNGEVTNVYFLYAGICLAILLILLTLDSKYFMEKL